MTTIQSRMLTDTRLEPLSVEEARALPASFPAFPIIARVLCIQRTAFYEGAKQGTLPISLIKVNRQLIGRKVDVLNFLGLSEESGAGPACEAGPSAGNDEEAACEAASPVEQSATTSK